MKSETKQPAVAGPVEPKVRPVIDKARIAEEAKHFFEWPDTAAHRDTVTLTSCVIFANVIAEMARTEERKRWETAIGAVMPQDFKQWRDNPQERPETAAWCITNAREERDAAEQNITAMTERLIRELEAHRQYARALCKAVDAATDFAGTVAGGASWWDDVWADHAAALDRAREQVSLAGGA